MKDTLGRMSARWRMCCAPNHFVGDASPRSLLALSVAGREIGDALSAFTQYVTEHGTTTRQYDVVERGDPNVLSREDVVQTRVIAARVSEEELEWFVRMGRTAPWSTVPAALDLEIVTLP